MLCVRDRVIPIKLASERALVYIFMIKNGAPQGDVLSKYMASLDSGTSRSIGDYVRRVLTKIGEKESDDES